MPDGLYIYLDRLAKLARSIFLTEAGSMVFCDRFKETIDTFDRLKSEIIYKVSNEEDYFGGGELPSGQLIAFVGIV
jgi:hypothetical protein